MATDELILRRDGDAPPAGRQRFAQHRLQRVFIDRFTTESGQVLVNLRIAYRVFGSPNATRSNVVLVYHALTGDANCAGYEGPDGHVNGWWEPLFGPGAPLDLAEVCVIAPNHPGSCYGSSGPLDLTIDGDAPLGLNFPSLSPRDIVRLYLTLLDFLCISQVRLVLGGSLGGMLALETAIIAPELAERVAVIAAPAESSAQSVAFNHIQRRCFELDRNFNGGDYYGRAMPVLALSLARQIAMITYRSPVEMTQRFGRNVQADTQRRRRYYEVESYLDYQGEKLISRFDPNSYLKLLDTLDAHDIGQGRGGVEAAVSAIRAKLLLVGIDTDILYAPVEVKAVYRACRRVGIDASYRQIETIHGHDGFLIEFAQVHSILHDFLYDDATSP